jgi:serine protease Do
MSKRSIGLVVAAAFALVAFTALPGGSMPRSSVTQFGLPQSADWGRLQAKLDNELARWQTKAEAKLQRLQELRARELDEKLRRAEEWQERTEKGWEYQQDRMAKRMAEEHARWAEHMHEFEFDGLEQEPMVWLGEEDSGWLGVTIDEVTSEKAKEAKLQAERGVFVREVSSDSPASKAGLKAGDVITEFNGQRVEGAVQFRRLVRETPAGRTVQLTVWRDGRAQTLSAQLGSGRERIERSIRIRPDMDFRIEVPRMEGFSFGSMGRTPTLGVHVDDLSGQLGSYFGAPDGEGILVREVVSGSPAEKAGMKAGDVIVKIEGKRVRSTSEMREQLREKRESKTVAVGILRKGAEMSLNVEIEQPQTRRPARVISRRTSL